MKEIFVRLERCLGCKSCELACAVEHSATKHLFAAIAETPRPRQRIYVESGRAHKMPLTCRHCEEAPCIDACITGAMHRDLRGVVTNVGGVQECIGCWMCLMVCPYGVVGRQVETKLALKCDLCPDRETPACVEACPTKALVYTEAEGFSRLVRQEAASTLAISLGR
nr:4Fe-4S dicluster domain-containing protein [Anaerolineae bacterium]